MLEKLPKPLSLHPRIAATQESVCTTRQAKLFTSVEKARRYDVPLARSQTGQTDTHTHTHTHTKRERCRQRERETDREREREREKERGRQREEER